MRIACAQILSGTDPAANLQTVADYTDRAAADGAKLVAFPEATMCRFGVPLGPVAEPLDGRWATGVREIAARAGVTVVAGMFTPSGDGRVHNTLLATGPNTDTHYHKIHLYDAFGFTESRTVAPGCDPVVIDVDGVGVGLSTCYDIRFPALYAELADRGAQLITVSASWGAGPGKVRQWELLACARALDSTSYIAAVGQADPGSADSSGAPTGVGHSLVASPWGEALASAGASPQLVVYDIDLEAVTTARRTLAVLSNRADFIQVGKAESRG
ncbi:carbon-nitrogen hydrolase family protein [[Mycobacterium] nativiensis]|uniref:Carbon-nitrogen hydrolase family protein n=1 Tax=[Mycobacterium] nativiensis TaxID=2855503 RepID=A0ABU5XWW8_9MYCO|nr:carbon-nitrogen hydrolase family protein [Mycolicibacter sp. MYC340]MEB3032460.1 carbon-nitrogen hydrolase family protein [Mycolicibacter sp. MYC340]